MWHCVISIEAWWFKAQRSIWYLKLSVSMTKFHNQEEKETSAKPPCRGVDAIQPWKTNGDRKKILVSSQHRKLFGSPWKTTDWQMIMIHISLWVSQSKCHNIYFYDINNLWHNRVCGQIERLTVLALFEPHSWIEPHPQEIMLKCNFHAFFM